ncbi:MAG: class I SAM-dependent methyltransferase [Ruminococcus sp.]|nr:class I SAM-dependent methyltransferase [Ruminococcus sp.]MCM1154682.1 class I SAM-dependent methyltransferase [Roseburia sp.]MCM1233929.1 class I SAM-dependent methyltransferase [Ruminococcus flavefaciens]
MRITEQITNIEYEETKQFFKSRAGKFHEDNPYAVTMYQDNNKELVKQRNRMETEKLYPLLKLNTDSRVLDIACGIGRWADAIKTDIEEYCGLDFSRELIEIARKRNERGNFFFFEGAANAIEKVLQVHGRSKYNTILMIGILMYLNDEDIIDALKQIERNCEQKTVICIREPVGIKDRLTLKNDFSDELQDNYNAIYRTRDEIMGFLKEAFLEKGFVIKEENFLFEDDSLNNRKETAQYYFILERE